MNNTVYRLVYCSRNKIRGTSTEILDTVQVVLASARRNNARAGITGALLFNEGLFAQVLEGPLAAVERVFEQIQRDPRHSDVTVLQTGTTGERDFPEWSMAFAAATNAKSPSGFGIPAFPTAFSNPSLAGELVLQLLHEVVIQEDWIMI